MIAWPAVRTVRRAADGPFVQINHGPSEGDSNALKRSAESSQTAGVSNLKRLRRLCLNARYCVRLFACHYRTYTLFFGTWLFKNSKQPWHWSCVEVRSTWPSNRAPACPLMARVTYSSELFVVRDERGSNPVSVQRSARAKAMLQCVCYKHSLLVLIN